MQQVANTQKFVQQGEIEFRPGKTTRLELEKNIFITSHYLIFDYLMAVANGGQAPDGFRDFARIANVIRELKITINDRDDILRVSGFDLVAIYVADHGRFPSTLPLVRGNSGQTRAILPINQWTTNSDLIALTGHDFRNVNKVDLYITWGDVGDTFVNAGDLSFDNFKLELESQGHHVYRSPVTGMVNPNNNRPRRYNPAVRYFNRTEEVFTSARTSVELGRIEATEERLTVKGAILFARQENGLVIPDAFDGTITMRQGDTTLSKVSVDVLRASHETAKGQATPPEILYLPFSALFRNMDFLNSNRWDNDIIIEGDFNHQGEENDRNVVTVMTDSYRQERRR